MCTPRPIICNSPTGARPARPFDTLPRLSASLVRPAAGALCAALLAACGSSDDGPPAPPPTIPAPTTITVPHTNGATTTANAPAYWNQVAANTINVPGTPTGATPEERRPVLPIDLATVHVAIHDAVVAIDGRYQPFATTPVADASGASADAAVAAAAHGVLKGLFPGRTAQYQAAYDDFVASLPPGEATDKGLALGAEVATKTLALRADDGRATDVTYTPGTLPGQFRGVNPVNPWQPFIKPFTLTSASQFRPEPPPPLDSTLYATDYAEVMALGGTDSAERTPEQLDAARFHTEAPNAWAARNYRQFAMDDQARADNARLMAMIWVAQADAAIACWDAKYHYDFWRPQSAIPLAATDGNAATVPDPAWTPVLPTPNHPEYPSAHACLNAAAVAALKAVLGTNQIAFAFSSTVTGATRQYATPDDLLAEILLARITGGMHYRNSNVQGAALGSRVANWVVTNHFRPRS